LGCETTAPCDTSFKARRIEISLLPYLLTYKKDCKVDVQVTSDDEWGVVAAKERKELNSSRKK